MFWPGSEAVFPTLGLGNRSMTRSRTRDRVAQVLAWLRLPDAERPSFLTLYMSDVDSASHQSGPLSPGARDTAPATCRCNRRDARRGCRGTEALSQTTLVIMSDHGMSETSSEQQIYLSDYLDTRRGRDRRQRALVGLDPFGTTSVDAIYDKLVNRHPSLSVYLVRIFRSGSATARTRAYRQSWVWSKPDGRPYEPALGAPASPAHGGAHGYEPRYADVHGLFVAAGPRIRRGVSRADAAEKTCMCTSFLCAVLGLTPAHRRRRQSYADRESVRALDPQRAGISCPVR